MDKEFIFKTREDFREWLNNYGSTNEGIWLIFGKSNKIKTLSAEEALEEALCFGWIDGLINSIDDDKYRKYFSKRRKRSKWSEKNKKLVEKLINENKMTDSGLQMIDEAKKNGEWGKVQDRSISEIQKSEFESKIKHEQMAFNNYCSLSQSVQKQFIGFYFDAKKEETRQKRFERIIELLEKNKRLM
jgi:uncharacterized protein YdeI (YjbR/CyaY-like superfamily)